MGKLLALPDEILDDIALHLANERVVQIEPDKTCRYEYPDIVQVRHALRNLTASCSRLRRIVQPFLVRSLDDCPTFETVGLFLRTALERPDLRSCVRYVNVHGIHMPSNLDLPQFARACLRIALPRLEMEAYLRALSEGRSNARDAIVPIFLATFPNLQGVHVPYPQRRMTHLVQSVSPLVETAAICSKLTSLSIDCQGMYEVDLGPAYELLALPTLRQLALYSKYLRRVLSLRPGTCHATTLKLMPGGITCQAFQSFCDASIALKNVSVLYMTSEYQGMTIAQRPLTLKHTVSALNRHKETLTCLHINPSLLTYRGGYLLPRERPLVDLQQFEVLEELLVPIRALVEFCGGTEKRSLLHSFPQSIKRLKFVEARISHHPIVEDFAQLAGATYLNLERVDIEALNHYEQYFDLFHIFKEQGINCKIKPFIRSKGVRCRGTPSLADPSGG